ncbi:DUF885 family protein [Novosphingobium sp. Gsoil 351]|uniref:DUF885 domain-containing protein n=1 Tax=Novosphingobium sp. Gsoil 351 TaxID=2675225 RepID=UPI0012B4CB02|nr:DUF885 family protein [Novosphingobium sp. Gsoil 351]QGN56002.1 DUF885 family protein [Novosphingobium sp. Gsoil 351]
MDRRTFIASAGAAATLGHGDIVLAAPAARGDAALSATLDAEFNDDIVNNPEDATGLGLDRGKLAALKSRLQPRTKAWRDRELARNQRWLKRVRAFDPASLSGAARLWREQTIYDLEQKTVAPARFGINSVQRPYRIFQQGGSYFSIPDFLNSQHTIESAADAGAYLARLDAFATALDQDTAEQKAQSRRGFTAPGWSIDLTLGQMNKLRGQQAEGSALVQSLVRRAAAKGIAGDWQARAASIVNRRIYPALDRQIALMETLRKSTAAGDGAWRLPRGDEIYAAALAQATTTTLSPDEVHQIGLDQVADISAQLDGILRTAGLTKGGVGERLAALNVRPDQLYPDSDAGRKALIADLNAGVKDMYARLPQAFSTVPQQPLEIRAVPVDIQDGASNGYYNRASLDGKRPAIYWINLKSVGDWPKYSLPSLTYHEGVPGHHLQGSIAQLSGAVPMIIRNNFISAYGEGWALYAEQLADELGAYSGIERAGYLQSFLFRASRLVIDTGLHHKRWTRKQATDYMVTTTGFARPRSQREVERYCTQPGQACSYKIGHTAWVKNRQKAQAALGPRFDLKWFHDVLNDGVMPLSMLDARVDQRIAERLKTMR